MKNIRKYVAFLRGINVGGHHKVPMAELREELQKLNCRNVITILNSGNIIFESEHSDPDHLERTISVQLEKAFGFPIPTFVRTSKSINKMVTNGPFMDEILTKDIRWYVSFLRKETNKKLPLPWSSDDGSFRIIAHTDKTIYSILDLTEAKSPKTMEFFERLFGKDLTTRNWNTIKRIEQKLEL